MGKLSPIKRLKKQLDFVRAKRLRYSRITNKYFFLNYRNSSYQEIGLIIKKRYLKKATQRNKLKRNIFEYLRLNQSSIPCVTLIIGLRCNVDEVPIKELKWYINQLINKLILKCKQL